MLLNFRAAWSEKPTDVSPLKAIYDRFGGNNKFAMMSINLDMKPQDATTYVQTNHLQWNQINPPDGMSAKVARDYALRSLPSTWLIGPDGKVIAKDIRDTDVRSAVASALGEAK